VSELGTREISPGEQGLELLQLEEADAWLEYLQATRAVAGRRERYEEVEPWAWARLNVRLRAIRARRAKLAPAA
jgi:hypothetical protein